MQQNWKEGGNNGSDKTNDNIETANNVDKEVNINSDSDDSDSEFEDLELNKLWQLQQNWKEGGNNGFDNVDKEVNINSDYDDSDSEFEDLECEDGWEWGC